ncbi:LTA synthase family protein [Flavobacterium antarcticum]|uniref:LTA synthase family protein n=1 Tax=Flavobacterium antarcticum TaxID=271155 RepID=UPI0003B6DBAD|nr:alkaline phosphatase family protein [Flavobacterium antarcticum]
MHYIFRGNEYKVLGYRLLLAYFFYFVTRLLFFIYNSNLVKIDSIYEFFRLYYHGIAFDTTAILYSNSLFIILSVVPAVINTKRSYQNILFYIYFLCNLSIWSSNFIDLIYFRFIFSRTTFAAMDTLEHESNKMLLFKSFLVNYWHVFLLLFICSALWIYLYKKVKVRPEAPLVNGKYFVYSTIAFLGIVTLAIGGIRGDFRKSTRPINLLDANRYVTNISQGDFVLNTPFAIIRTLNVNTFKKVDGVSDQDIKKYVQPIKEYHNFPATKPNVVVLIMESNGREYFGSFNKDLAIPGYKSYTPFVDSLAQHSLIFTNAYANGYKSIHGMSSILAGIPSFKDAYTSSAFVKQKTQSLVSVLNEQGYDTSFFHGAPNGSMGFLGFGNILGIQHYYGKTEYNNDTDFDGVWGIWDEPFFQYMKTVLDKKQQPFMATLFSVSSHDPYKVPEKYAGKFPKGDVNIHESIGYSDYALRQFFAAAKKEPWFKNTIFVMVADHTNTVFYDEYLKEFMRNTVPILFYTADERFKGVNDDWAQQIDIYPTILDMIGYQKPFRSWGRSLIDPNGQEPFVVKHAGNLYQYMSGDYICTFDGKKAVGFYAKDDKGMERNLIANRTPEMDLLEIKVKAFVQDYMNTIIDKKLSPKK